MPQILLSPYFREELQQRTQDGVCSGRAPLAPAGLHQVSGLSSWRSWGCLLGVGSSRIAVLEGPVSPQDEVGRLWMDRYTWPGRGVQAGNVTGITTGGEEERPEGGKWVPADPTQVMVVFWKQLRAGMIALRGTASFSYSFVKHCVRD